MSKVYSLRLTTTTALENSSSTLPVRTVMLLYYSAMKFWIGGAAETANMSVVWAQLYINGKSHGVHAYVVPIRDPLTHKLLPGVLVGDCGPKSGLNGIDNGFLLFDKVRIPVGNQLDRISGVDEKG